jgi:hypothetical protein
MGRESRKEVVLERSTDEDLLEELVSERTSERIEGVIIGRLADLGPDGEPMVDYPGKPQDGPVAARATGAVARSDVGREVALLFENGDPARPILVGCVNDRVAEASASVDAEVDGREVTLRGKNRVVLRCGKASITLTRDGRIALRGVQLLSRATRSNRIKGGSVQLN